MAKTGVYKQDWENPVPTNTWNRTPAHDAAEPRPGTEPQRKVPAPRGGCAAPRHSQAKSKRRERREGKCDRCLVVLRVPDHVEAGPSAANPATQVTRRPLPRPSGSHAKCGAALSPRDAMEDFGRRHFSGARGLHDRGHESHPPCLAHHGCVERWSSLVCRYAAARVSWTAAMAMSSAAGNPDKLEICSDAQSTNFSADSAHDDLTDACW